MGETMKMIRNIITITAVATLCVGITAVRGEERETIHRTFDLGAGATVEVHNINGNVRVEAWDESHVDMEAIKKTRYDREALDRIEIDIEQTGNILIITTHNRKYSNDENGSFFSRLFRNFSGNNSPGSVDYTLKIPYDIEDLVAKSVNGNVDLDGAGGEIEASTTNGSIDIENAIGFVSAHTTNGSVSVDGSPRLREASTTNGDVEVSLANDISDPVHLRTTNGSIRIAVDPDLDAYLNLKTTNGSINVSGFRLTVDEVSKRRVRGMLGDGGIEIDASTLNGGITLISR